MTKRPAVACCLFCWGPDPDRADFVPPTAPVLAELFGAAPRESRGPLFWHQACAGRAEDRLRKWAAKSRAVAEEVHGCTPG